MAQCRYCGNTVDYAHDPGCGWSDKSLTTSEDGRYCPDPAALASPGVSVGQDPVHQLEDGVGVP